MSPKEATTETMEENDDNDKELDVDKKNTNNNDGSVSQQQQQLQRNNDTSIDDDDNDDDKQSETKSKLSTLCSKLHRFYQQYEFLVWIVFAIGLARAYPPLGAVYVQPHITSTWIAVVFIFVLAGLSLKTEEFAKALQRLYFNVFVQVFSFGVDSAVVFGVSRALLQAGALNVPLANGMVVCASLGMTINMVLVLTASGNGDQAAAIFNAAFGNMVGVFVTPLLVLGYIGVTGSIDLADVFYKLAVRVVAPIVVGQILRKLSPPTVAFYMKHKATFKQMQQLTLVFIVYTVFCTTFFESSSNADDPNLVEATAVDVLVMIVVELVCLVGLMGLAWVSLRIFFRDEPRLRVMGLFGCTHKTVAMGVPLINAIYEGDPNIGLITLPLLIWHTSQLILGSMLAPKLAAWVLSEEERLGIVHDDDDDDDDAEKSKNDTASAAAAATANEENDNDSNVDEERPPPPMDTTTTTSPTTTTAKRISSIYGSYDTDGNNNNNDITVDIEERPGQSDEESL